MTAPLTPLVQEQVQRHRIEAYIDAVAAAIELPIAPEHREGVVRYFELAAELAGRIAAVPLGVADDPAPVFRPIAPDDLPDR